MIPRPRILPFGDAALLVELGVGVDRAVKIDRALNAAALAIAAAIHADAGGPWGCPVPAYDSVLVPLDLLAPSGEEAVERLATLIGAVPEEALGPALDDADDRGVIEIPTHYGGPDGPDLDEVAGQLGLHPAQVIEAHAGSVYRVFFLGFAPGFGYLGILPDSIVVPRRPSPRTRVPAGSVAIAGAQTAVYPSTMPGGWNLIGRTDLATWDARRDPPALLRPGAAVRFVPVLA
jgi:KipI family sensor histidine kinase inhibitor